MKAQLNVSKVYTKVVKHFDQFDVTTLVGDTQTRYRVTLTGLENGRPELSIEAFIGAVSKGTITLVYTKTKNARDQARGVFEYLHKSENFDQFNIRFGESIKIAKDDSNVLIERIDA